MPDEIKIEYELTIPVVITADILGENRDARFDEPGEQQFPGDINVFWNQENITAKLSEEQMQRIRNVCEMEINYRGATHEL